MVKDSTVVIHSGGGAGSTEINKAAKILLWDKIIYHMSSLILLVSVLISDGDSQSQLQTSESRKASVN